MDLPARCAQLASDRQRGLQNPEHFPWRGMYRSQRDRARSFCENKDVLRFGNEKDPDTPTLEHHPGSWPSYSTSQTLAHAYREEQSCPISVDLSPNLPTWIQEADFGTYLNSLKKR